MAPLAVALAVPFVQAIEGVGIPRIDPSFWSPLPAVGVALIGLVWMDFVNYWSHRLRHMGPLWPMHAVHHSDTKMSFLSYYRNHITESVFIPLFHVAFASWLGVSPSAIGGIVLLAGLHQMYVHADLEWDHGPLKRVIASPQFHKWHHANHPDAIDKNFAEILPLWDILFGTYHNPGRCTASTGFVGNPGESASALILYPFKQWGLMTTRVFGRAAQYVRGAEKAA